MSRLTLSWELKTEQIFNIWHKDVNPFTATVAKNGIKIYNKSGELIRQIKEFIGFWNGYDAISNKHGNTLFVWVDDDKETNKYTYIGSEIYSFTNKEEVLDYYSPIFSDISYPICFSEDRIFFMNDKQFVAKDTINLKLSSENSNEVYEEFSKSSGKQRMKNLKVSV